MSFVTERIFQLQHIADKFSERDTILFRICKNEMWYGQFINTAFETNRLDNVNVVLLVVFCQLYFIDEKNKR